MRTTCFFSVCHTVKLTLEEIDSLEGALKMVSFWREFFFVFCFLKRCFFCVFYLIHSTSHLSQWTTQRWAASEKRVELLKLDGIWWKFRHPTWWMPFYCVQYPVRLQNAKPWNWCLMAQNVGTEHSARYSFSGAWTKSTFRPIPPCFSEKRRKKQLLWKELS